MLFCESEFITRVASFLFIPSILQTLQDGSNDEKLANNTLHIGKANSVRYAYYVVCFSRKAHKRIKRKKLSFRGFSRIKDNPQSPVAHTRAGISFISSGSS